MKTVAVIGTGFMGAGIIQALAQSGYNVTIIATSDEKARLVKERILKYMNKDAEKGIISREAADRANTLLTATNNIEEAKNSWMVIEVVPERMALKKDLFKRLNEICPPGVIFGTNTSTLPVTELAAASGRPEKFIGVHFFFPIPRSPLVELVPGHNTSAETLTEAIDFVLSLGKDYVVAKPYPAFIVNRIIGAAMSEAFWLLWEGNKPEDVDKSLKLSMSWPLGPLELADHIGLDVVLDCATAVYENFQDPRYRVSPILKEYVAAGRLGRKTGRGVYQYQR